MRKELLVFISTAEQGEEISVLSVAKKREFVLLNVGGNKFTANRKELIEALNAIGEFDEANNTNTQAIENTTNTFEDVAYGETDT